MRILGIDPGSRLTGFGVVHILSSGKISYVASGVVRVPAIALAERLKVIYEGVAEVIAAYRPEVMAVEKVFMARNADSALKLGQARGAAICGAVGTVPAIAEYSPREVKLAVVGKGGATKEQVQHMVRVLLKLTVNLQPDQADALAIALCHSHMRQTLAKIPGARAARGGRFR